MRARSVPGIIRWARDRSGSGTHFVALAPAKLLLRRAECKDEVPMGDGALWDPHCANAPTPLRKAPEQHRIASVQFSMKAKRVLGPSSF